VDDSPVVKSNGELKKVEYEVPRLRGKGDYEWHIIVKRQEDAIGGWGRKKK